MKKKPNIILLFSDQQRWDTVGCYGQDLDVTPNLDKMASEGVRIDKAFTCQPVCGPARACLQTGKYATEIGCFRNGIKLPLGENTIAMELNDAGYETAYVGKWHLASTINSYIDKDNDPSDVFRTKAVPKERRGGYKDYWIASDVLEATSHGYDGYVFDQNMNKVEFEGFRADCITDFGLEYLRNKKSNKPFFLMISYIEPHHQNDRNAVEGPEGSKERFKGFTVPDDLQGLQGNWKENYPDYLGCCNSLDNNLGRIRDELEQLGLTDNTLIIYTSDHGSHFRTRNSEYKRSCHEGSIRIPMIMYGPGFKGGKVINELISLIDIPPTILKAADQNIPSAMKGNPIQKIINDKEIDWPQEVFIQISESQVGRAIRTDKWKYSVSALDKDPWNQSSSDTYKEEFLYDLELDTYEKNNLIKDPNLEGIRMQLSNKLKNKMIEAGENEPIILKAEHVGW